MLNAPGQNNSLQPNEDKSEVSDILTYTNIIK